MENREQEILSEIKSMMASIRSQLEILDAKMAELQQVVDPEGFEANSINIEIDESEIQAEPLAVEIQTIPLVADEPAPAEEDDDLPFADVAVEPEQPEEPVQPVEPEQPEEPVQPAEPAQPAEPVKSVEPEEDDDDLPGIFDVPEVVTVAAKSSSSAKPTINDAHSADQAWRKDMPGSPVRDIRSAISLNDRVFFINSLFDENAQTFVDTLMQINTMESLDQVVEYITGRFPEWDLNSETVYRFMMAVRRKVK